jgi:hypothetical protein
VTTPKMGPQQQQGVGLAFASRDFPLVIIFFPTQQPFAASTPPPLPIYAAVDQGVGLSLGLSQAADGKLTRSTGIGSQVVQQEHQEPVASLRAHHVGSLIVAGPAEQRDDIGDRPQLDAFAGQLGVS